ncbi:MAG: hypothetical protein DMF55_06505 [Acidobacteria bacterium]|nr:MAG: hypothetical protein DMF55_06505 [Acidobacteriota bacterium]
MDKQNFRRLLLVAVLVGVGWWIHEKHLTIQGVVDAITRPLMGSRAAVKESEQKRVVADASQVVARDEEKPVEALHEGMTDLEVRGLLGDPDEILPDRDNPLRLMWVYKKIDQIVVIEHYRVVSIAIR